MSYPRASIFFGCPSPGVLAEIDDLLDNRLAASSMKSIKSALGHWDQIVATYGWPRIIASDDPTRGAKLATWVCALVRDTTLTASSIGNYVWALRTWMKLQRQADPIFGVVEWHDFMDMASSLCGAPFSFAALVEHHRQRAASVYAASCFLVAVWRTE